MAEQEKLEQGREEEKAPETEAEVVVDSSEKLEQLGQKTVEGVKEETEQARQEIEERLDFFVSGGRSGEEKKQAEGLTKRQEKEVEKLGERALAQIEGVEQGEELEQGQSPEEKKQKFEALRIPEEVESGTVEMVGYQLYNSSLLAGEQIDAAFLKLGAERVSGDVEVMERMREEKELMIQLGIILEQTGLDLNSSIRGSGPELIARLLKPYRGFSAEMMGEIIDRWETWLKGQPEWGENKGHRLNVLFEERTRELRYSNEEIELAIQDLKARFANESAKIQESAAGQEAEKEIKKKPKGAVEQEKLPILSGETFDPEEELKKVRQGPKEEQPQALAEFKRRLAYQKEGLAGMQGSLIEMIRENPDVSFAELYEELDVFRHQYGLTFQQERVARTTLMKYMQKHEAIKEIREKHPDNEQLFAALFGKKPKGKIEIIEGPITLFFRCRNENDFYTIFFQGYDKVPNRNEAQFLVAQLSGGVSVEFCSVPGLEGVITAEKAFDREIDEAGTTIFVHEEQHAIKKLFTEVNYRENTFQKLESAKTDKERGLLIEGYYRWIRDEKSDVRIKDEILAYFKSGYAPEEIIAILFQPGERGGLYDYAAEEREILPPFLVRKLGEEYRDSIEKAFEKVFVTEHRKLVKDSVSAFEELRAVGYSAQETIAILITEPLGKWKKVVKRLLEQKKETGIRVEFLDKGVQKEQYQAGREGSFKTNISKLRAKIRKVFGKE